MQRPSIPAAERHAGRLATGSFVNGFVVSGSGLPSLQHNLEVFTSALPLLIEIRGSTLLRPAGAKLRPAHKAKAVELPEPAHTIWTLTFARAASTRAPQLNGDTCASICSCELTSRLTPAFQPGRLLNTCGAAGCKRLLGGPTNPHQARLSPVELARDSGYPLQDNMQPPPNSSASRPRARKC